MQMQMPITVKVAGLRIYLIEDSVPLREQLEDRFEAMMARMVGWSDTEQEGAQWLTKNESAWDLVIVDPFVNARLKGYGILVRCKNRRADQKIVVLTVYATRQVRRSSLANGANAVFDKALELEDLFRYVAGELKTCQ